VKEFFFMFFVNEKMCLKNHFSKNPSDYIEVQCNNDPLFRDFYIFLERDTREQQ
jgi:hypothetical protein